MSGCNCGTTRTITVWVVTLPNGETKDFHREDKARAHAEEVTGTVEAKRLTL